MWVLEILDTDGGNSVTDSLLLVGPRVTIGRSKGDITFPTNKTVSRAHAAFLVSASGLALVDTASASGVFVDGKKIRPSVEYPMNDGMIISFGMVKATSTQQASLGCGMGAGCSRVKVCQQSLKLCATRLDRPDRDCLKSDISALSSMGIRCAMEEEARKCSHLICNKFSCTAKLLGAIVYQRPVVTSAWLHDLRCKVDVIRRDPAEGISRVLSLPIQTQSHAPPGMDASRLVGPEQARGLILKDVLVVLFVPSNDVYHSVLLGCGAQVLRMYGSDSLGSCSAGTFPQAFDGSSDGLKKGGQSSLSQLGAIGAVGVGITSSAQPHAGTAGSQLMPPPLEVLSCTAAEASQQCGQNTSKAALNQKIKSHIKQMSASRPSGAMSCCIFLENQDDINKEMLSLSKINGIGFLEPSGLASGVFANTIPVVISRDALRSKIEAKNLTTQPDTLDINMNVNIVRRPHSNECAVSTSSAAKTVAASEDRYPQPPVAVSPPPPPPVLKPVKASSPIDDKIPEIKPRPLSSRAQGSMDSGRNAGQLLTDGWGDDDDAPTLPQKSDGAKQVFENVNTKDSVANSISLKVSAEREEAYGKSNFFPDSAPMDIDSINTEAVPVSKPATHTRSARGNSTKSTPPSVKAAPKRKTPQISRIAEEVSRAREEAPVPLCEEGWLPCGHDNQKGQAVDVANFNSPQASGRLPKPVAESSIAAARANVDVDPPGPPVVEERFMALKPRALEFASDISGSSANSCNGGDPTSRNVKRFKKNRVRGVYEPGGGGPGMVRAASMGREACISRMDMDKVLPKESERELQLRLEVENFQQREQDQDEMMFAERFANRSLKKLRVA